ncbi:MAG: caspase family protein [Elusimicrobiota bacterium]|jgi:hypothetical protein
MKLWGYFILSAGLCGPACAQSGREVAVNYSDVSSVHNRDTDADREARRSPPLPRFVTSPVSYQSPPRTYPQTAYPNTQGHRQPYVREAVAPVDPYRQRHPPEFVDFGDEFTGIVSKFVAEQSQKNQGAFVVKDDQGGGYLYLKLSQVYRDRITRVTPTDVFGCVEFEGFHGTSGKFDLDFYLNNEDWEWKVAKLLIHKVNGQARFHYNREHGIVALNARDVGMAGSGPGTAPVVPKPLAPAGLKARVVFRDSAGSKVLAGDNKAELVVTVSNAGPGAAYAVRIVPSLQGDVPGLEMPAVVAVGEVAAGKSVEAVVPLAGAAELRSQKARLKLSVNEGNGFDAAPVLVEFRTLAVKPPRLEIAGVRLGGGGVVRAGESTPLSVILRNTGGGVAEGVKVALELGSPEIFMSGDPAVNLGVIKPGQTKAAEFEFFVKKRYAGTGVLPIALSVTEAKGKYGVATRPLNLALGQGAPALELVSVDGPGPGADEFEAVDVPPAAKSKLDPHAYAVVIGVEKYRDIPAVDFAARDAQAVYEYLTRAMGFDPKNVILLEDERASRTDMATYLGPWLRDRVPAGGRVFVYYSGHGSPDPTTGAGYLIPYDGNPNYVETTAFALRQLYDNLAGLPTKDVTVVLDSCFSGAGGRSFLAQGVRPLVNVKLAAPGGGMVVLSAAQGDQISTYFPETQHGMLTYFLLRGLRGAADADQDGSVTTRELFEYVRPLVEREARKQHVAQTPAIAPALEGLGERAGRAWIKLK